MFLCRTAQTRRVERSLYFPVRSSGRVVAWPTVHSSRANGREFGLPCRDFCKMVVNLGGSLHSRSHVAYGFSGDMSALPPPTPALFCSLFLRSDSRAFDRTRRTEDQRGHLSLAPLRWFSITDPPTYTPKLMLTRSLPPPLPTPYPPPPATEKRHERPVRTAGANARWRCSQRPRELLRDLRRTLPGSPKPQASDRGRGGGRQGLDLPETTKSAVHVSRPCCFGVTFERPWGQVLVC